MNKLLTLLSVVAICFVFFVGSLRAQTTKTTTKVTTQTTPTSNSSASQNSSAFLAYQKKFDKKYPSASAAAAAKTTYQKNVAAIQAHNANKNRTYNQSENDMTDMTYAQAVQARCGVNASAIAEKSAKSAQQPNITITSKNGKVHSVSAAAFGYKNDSVHMKSGKVGKAAQSSMDLRANFPPIRNQASCGSCWAFQVAGLVDNWQYTNGVKTIYSEQQVLDCSGAGT